MNRLFVFLASLFLVGCITQPQMPALQTATKRLATPTRPALPTRSETVHSWEAQPVLIQIYEGPGMTSETVAWTVMPTLVVYADGRVIRTKRDPYSANAWKGDIKLAHISPDQLCSLLIKIDQNGFFDFNPADYEVRPNMATDMGNTSIIVQAWRSNSVDALGYVISPALDKLYGMFLTYELPDAVPYQIEQVELLVRSWGHLNYGKLHPWPATLLPLKKIVPDVGQTVTILTGQDILDAYEFFGDAPDPFYVSEDDVWYQVAIRPLLPLELPRTPTWSPSKFEESPKVHLSCDTSAK